MDEQQHHAPYVSIGVREYIAETVKHERELADERQKAWSEKFLSIEEARRLAKEEQDHRLEGMNEFRDTLKDQQGTFITRSVWETGHKELSSRMDKQENWRAGIIGQMVGISGAFTAAAIVIGLLLKFVS